MTHPVAIPKKQAYIFPNTIKKDPTVEKTNFVIYACLNFAAN